MPRAAGLALLLGLGLASCSTLAPVAPAVTPEVMAHAGSVSAGTLEEGRRIFTRQCTSCHTADPVVKFTPGEWRAIVTDMAERSEINERQQAAVTVYILAARASQLTRSGS